MVNKKRLFVFSLVFLLFSTICFAEGIYLPWWEGVQNPVRTSTQDWPDQPAGICGRNLGGSMNFRVYVPSGVAGQIRIPRASLEKGMTYQELIAKLNDPGNWDTTGCPAFTASSATGVPAGPYVCFTAGGHVSSTFSITSGVSEDQIETVKEEIPGSFYDEVADTGGKKTSQFSTRSKVYISQFRMWIGNIPFGSETTAGYINSFLRDSITGLHLLSDGRGVNSSGDPNYIVIAINNTDFEIRLNDGSSDAKARRHVIARGGGFTAAPTWESDDSTWAFPTVPELGIWAIESDDACAHSYGDWDGKTCFDFGSRGATLEITLSFAAREYFSETRPELVLQDTGGIEANYNEQSDGFICEYQTTDWDGALSDGYKYKCERDTGEYIRENSRIVCVNPDFSCDGSSQRRYPNPEEYYSNGDRTYNAAKAEFHNTNLNTYYGRPSGGYNFYTSTPGRKRSLFDPDRDKQICMADDNCLSDWLESAPDTDATAGQYNYYSGGLNVLSGKNYCCGDDKEDVGYVQKVGNKYVMCLQNPDGKFVWTESDGSGYNGNVKGDIYDIYDDDYYKLETNVTSPAGATPVYGRVFPWDLAEYSVDQSYLSLGEAGWAMCSDHMSSSFKGPGLNTQNSPPTGTETVAKLYKLEPGEKLTIDTATGKNEYLCEEEESGARFSECYSSANLNNLDLLKAGNPGDVFWFSSNSATKSNAVVRVGSFEDFYPRYEDWEDQTGTLNVKSSSRYKTENHRGLEISFTKTGNEDSYLKTSSLKLPIEDSGHNYAYLEGQVFFDKTPALDIHIGSNVYHLEDYISGDIKLEGFNYFKIPVSLYAYMGLSSIMGDISFGFEPNSFSYNDETTYKFYIDNLNLIKKPSRDSWWGPPSYTSHFSFCGKVGDTATWVKDRDDSSFSCSDNIGLSFTDNLCCGDDSSFNRGEYYIDTNSGCWDSQVINPEQRFQVAKVEIENNDYEFVCTESYIPYCEKKLPRLNTDFNDDELVKVKSLDESSYEVYFEDYNDSSDSVSENLFINVHKWKYLLNDEYFEYCGDGDEDVEATLIRDKYPDIDINIVNYEQDGDSCSFTNNYFCSPSKGWINNNSDDIEKRDNYSLIGTSRDGNGAEPTIFERTTVKSIPPETWSNEVLPPLECCPETYCWTGKKCVEDQSDEAWKPLDFIDNTTIDENGYRCINGTWDYVYEKYSPEGDSKGYCEREDQCFVYKNGDYEDNDLSGNNPQCVNNDVYFGDFYCDQGNWSSRTKLLAGTLANNAGSTYELYCDNYKEVVNYAEKIFGKDITNYFDNRYSGDCAINIQSLDTPIDCINNMCVIINENNKLAFGVTLNQEIDAENKSASELFNNFGINNDIVLNRQMDRVKNNDSKFTSIYKPTLGTWYYENNNKILILSEFKIEYTSIWSKIATFFKDLFSWVGGETPVSEDIFSIDGINSQNDLNFLKHNKAYNTIYVFKEGESKEIVAFYGNQYDFEVDRPIPYVTAEYRGFNTDLCEEYFIPYNEKESFGDISIACSNYDEDNYFIFVYDEKVYGNKNLWQDLSSKLRVRD